MVRLGGRESPKEGSMNPKSMTGISLEETTLSNLIALCYQRHVNPLPFLKRLYPEFKWVWHVTKQDKRRRKKGGDSDLLCFCVSFQQKDRRGDVVDAQVVATLKGVSDRGRCNDLYVKKK